MTARPHVLVVDDDADLCQWAVDYFGEFNFRVSSASDGPAMHATLAREAVDLVLLDLKLKDEDGLSLARELRAQSSIPIVMLTSRRDDIDRILGLELGADDYITKPFNPRELLARLRAVLRRSQKSTSTAADSEGARVMRFAGWKLDLRNRKLTSDRDDRVELTRAEFMLLKAFLSAPQRILSREQLLELSRDEDDDNVFDRSIDVLILRLRRKLEIDPSRPELILTERGVGYLFDAEVETL
jgi:DNA-binding response OmpR family regulator